MLQLEFYCFCDRLTAMYCLSHFKVFRIIMTYITMLKPTESNFNQQRIHVHTQCISEFVQNKPDLESQSILAMKVPPPIQSSFIY